MLRFFRTHVSAKLATIWLVIAIPLSLVLLVTYYEWYLARYSLVQQERQGHAQETARAFELLLEKMHGSLRAVGDDIADTGPTSPASTAALKRLVAQYPVSQASFSDTAGRVLASSDPALIGSSVATDTAFRAAMSAPDGSGTEPSEVASGGAVGFDTAHVIPGSHSHPGGVMTMFVDVRRLARVFPVKVPSGGISIVDSAGQVVYQNETIVFAERRAPWGDEFPFIRAAQHGRVVTVQDWRFPLGGTRIAVFVPVEGGWAAGSSVAPLVALGPFYQTVAIGLPIAIAIGIVALFISIVLSRAIHRSLDQVAEGARRIGSGDLGQPVGTNREDEIGEVARSLEDARVELLQARERAERELATTTMLLGSSRALAERVEYDEVLGTLVEVLLETTSHTRSFVFSWNEEHRVAVQAASAGRQPFPSGTTFSADAMSVETQRSIKERRTLLVDFDALPPDRRGHGLAEQGSHLMISVPVVWGGRLVGLIGVDDPGERREFTDREIEVIEGIAAQAAVAIENARLFDEQARARAYAEKLDEINRLIHASLEAGQTMQAALELAGHTLGASAAALFLDSPEGSAAHYQYGFPESFVGTRYTGELFPFGRIMERTLEPVAITESQIPEMMDQGIAKQFGIRTLLAIPLVARGKLAGGIGMVFTEPRAFEEVEIDFARKVGATISLAIENAALYDASRRELARTTVLRDVATAASALSMSDVAVRVIETVQRLLGARSGVVYALDDHERVLRMAAMRGYPAEKAPLFAEVPVDERSISGTSVLHDRLLAARYDELPEATQERARAAGETGNGWVTIPAHAHGTVVGCITLVFPAEHTLEKADIALFGSLGDQLGVAMENARLFEAERERAHFGRSMVGINERLASSLDIDEVLPGVLQKACEEVGAIGATVDDRISGGWRIRHIVGIESDRLHPGTSFTEAQAPALMRLLKLREPEIVPDVDVCEYANRASAEQAGYRAYSAYPLVVRGEITGALTVFYAEPRRLPEQDLDYLRRLAFAVSLAEENSRLYESEHRIAETLQAALLALPDSIPGIEFAHLYHSATEAARVGGDFYDLFELEHDMVGITVGDMSGHGVDAAVLTSLVKNAIRVQATQQDTKPNEVMASASQLLYDNSPTEIFATVFFGVLHLDGGLLEYCNAGHTTGACICSDRGVRRLPGNSPLIGAFTGEEFELSTETLEPGDLLFLYTDGLTEARRDHELFGEERLFDLLADERGGDPERTLRRVIDNALAFAGGRLSDDLAILAVRRN